MRKAHVVCPVTCIENRYSMMARWEEKMFPVLEELQVGFVAFSPLANGILKMLIKIRHLQVLMITAVLCLNIRKRDIDKTSRL